MRSSVEIAEAVKLRYNEERKNGEKPDFTRIVLDEIAHDCKEDHSTNFDAEVRVKEVRAIIVVDALLYIAREKDHLRWRSFH